MAHNIGGLQKTVNGMRYCPHCDQRLPLTEYYKDRTMKGGLSNLCKKCDYKTMVKSKRRINMLTKYDISPEDYDNMLADQGSMCAICGGPNNLKRHLAVDYCHTTGKVRGLLCHRCNTVLGLCNESEDILRNMINYLEYYK